MATAAVASGQGATVVPPGGETAVIDTIFGRSGRLLARFFAPRHSMEVEPIARLFVAALRAISRPDPGQFLYLNAEPIGASLLARGASLTSVQPWRPEFVALEAAGARPVPTLASDGTLFDVVFVRLGRQREQNLATVAMAAERCGPRGVVIVAGENALGAASYAKRIGHTGSLSKHHARAFWFDAKSGPAAALLDAWRRAGALQRLQAGDFVAAPGVFAWDHVDPGSRLLAQSLPADISGDIADLGAGWGFLARACIGRGAAPRRLDLYEADWHALAAARINLGNQPGATALAYHWHDVTTGLDAARYDMIVTNPPFHDQRRVDPAIGIAFITVAAKALRPGGRLWLVANRHLSYERALAACFASTTLRAEDSRFKILEARR